MSTTTRTQITFCRDCAVEIEHGRLLCDACHTNALTHAQKEHPEILSYDDVSDVTGTAKGILVIALMLAAMLGGLSFAAKTLGGQITLAAVATLAALVALGALGVLVIRWGILAAKE